MRCYIMLCYSIPDNSSGQTSVDFDLLDQMMLNMAKFDDEYDNTDFFICGDMNGRMGSLLDSVELEVSSHLPLLDDFLEDIASLRIRRNMDTITNAQGKRLIEMCKMCNVRILNGRVGSDAHVGKFTCHVYNGSSTVDYMLAAPVNFEHVSVSCLGDINQYSDPIIVHYISKCSVILIFVTRLGKSTEKDDLEKWTNLRLHSKPCLCHCRTKVCDDGGGYTWNVECNQFYWHSKCRGSCVHTGNTQRTEPTFS